MQRLARRGVATAAETARNLNAFISVAKPQLTQSSGPLQGLKIAVKDNICTKDLPTTCASNGLRDYLSPYDATVVARLRDAGAIVTGKTNLDEFGMGSHSTHSAFGPVRNVCGSFSAGGSSGGSAVAVAAGECDAALGTDTGGSVRLPAAYNGVYGFKPSYGLISRWGVVAYANSLDTVGLLSDNLGTLQTLFGELSAYDDKDPTSLPQSTRAEIASRAKRDTTVPLRFGIPCEYNTAEVSETVRQVWARTIRYLKGQGHTVHAVSLPTTQQALSAYYILAPAEASSNLAKYDNARYGSPARSDQPSTGPLYAAGRQHGFGDEVRRRILLGSYSLSADAIDNYFIKAQKIRRLVQRDFDRVFDLPNILASETSDSSEEGVKVDALICPTANDLPPSSESLETQSPLDAYADDVFTVPASLAGLPVLNVPVGIKGRSPSSQRTSPDSVGIQIITQYGDDHTALRIGLMLAPLR